MRGRRSPVEKIMHFSDMKNFELLLFDGYGLEQSEVERRFRV
jgi:hypothetical protein